MKKKLLILGVVILTIVLSTVTVLADGTSETSNRFIATFWSLVPPVVAIVLALITKEVYSSLFIGIVVGALFYNNFNVVGTINSVVNDGLISAVNGTAGIFVFLVILGILVALINKTGGSAAFGKWAQAHIKTRTGAMLCTFALGVLISSTTILTVSPSARSCVPSLTATRSRAPSSPTSSTPPPHPFA